jgi:hypothetical protein
MAMDRPSPLPGVGDQRGIALLVVLLFLPIIFAIVGQLAFDSEVEHRAAVNVKDLAIIEYAIDGEFELSLARLTYDKRQSDVDSEFDDWAKPASERERAATEVMVSSEVADETGKFSLTRLTSGSEAQQTRAREILVRIIDLYREETSEDVSLVDAQEIVENIVAHLRRETAPGGVPHPKTNPPGVPLLLEEMLFVDPKRMPNLLIDVRTREKRIAEGLQRYVTTFGTGKVNLNTAPLLVLQAFFSEPRDRELAQGIIDRRSGPPATDTGRPSPSTPAGEEEETGNPFTDVNQITEVEGLTTEVLTKNGIEPANDFDVKSDFFSIRITGETKATQRLELYVVERVGTDGFRFLLHQERTDPVLEEETDSFGR